MLFRSVENAYIESFNGRLRDECLNVNDFISLKDAQNTIGDWKEDYNDERPHSALDGLTPSEFAERHERLLNKKPLGSDQLTLA